MTTGTLHFMYMYIYMYIHVHVHCTFESDIANHLIPKAMGLVQCSNDW